MFLLFCSGSPLRLDCECLLISRITYHILKWSYLNVDRFLWFIFSQCYLHVRAKPKVGEITGNSDSVFVILKRGSNMFTFNFLFLRFKTTMPYKLIYLGWALSFGIYFVLNLHVFKHIFLSNYTQLFTSYENTILLSVNYSWNYKWW